MVYKDGIRYDREYVVYLTADDFVDDHVTGAKAMFIGEGYCNPSAVLGTVWCFSGLKSIPINALIKSISMYGINDHANSEIKFYIKKITNILSGQPVQTELHSAVLSGVGDKVSTWTPSPAHRLIDEEPIIIAIRLYAEVLTLNCRFKACKIVYEA